MDGSDSKGEFAIDDASPMGVYKLMLDNGNVVPERQHMPSSGLRKESTGAQLVALKSTTPRLTKQINTNKMVRIRNNTERIQQLEDTIQQLRGTIEQQDTALAELKSLIADQKEKQEQQNQQITALRQLINNTDSKLTIETAKHEGNETYY